MQKTAQKRSVLNKLREKTNISGIAAEKFFNPEFESVMNSLRIADNKVRAITAGVDIEGESPGDDPVALKELIKNAKSYLNRREYMTAIAYLGRFHKKLHEIIKVFKTLDTDVDKVHHDFLFKDLDHEQKKHLHDLKSRLTASQSHALIAEANIMDFLFNVGTERGRALAAWEKRYPKQIGKLKKDLLALFNKSEQFLKSLLSSLKEMASYRATRKVDDYMKTASKLESQYVNNYDKSFRDFYNVNVKGFLEKQELIAPTKSVDDEKDLGKQEIELEKNEPAEESIPDESTTSNIPVPLVNKIEPAQAPAATKTMPVPPGPQSSYPEGPIPGELPPPGSPLLAPPKLPTNLGPAVPTRDTSIRPPEFEEDPDTEPMHEIPSSENIKASHLKFFNSLNVLANEKSEFLVSHILRYANSIKNTDPQVSKQLLKIAQSIKE